MINVCVTLYLISSLRLKILILSIPKYNWLSIIDWFTERHTLLKGKK